MNITSHEGYGGDINFSMGVSMDGTVTGVEMLSLSETAGLGMRAKDEEFKGQFAGKIVDQFVVTKTVLPRKTRLMRSAEQPLLPKR